MLQEPIKNTIFILMTSENQHLEQGAFSAFLDLINLLSIELVG